MVIIKLVSLLLLHLHFALCNGNIFFITIPGLIILIKQSSRIHYPVCFCLKGATEEDGREAWAASRSYDTYFIQPQSQAEKPIRDSLALGISCYFAGIQMDTIANKMLLPALLLLEDTQKSTKYITMALGYYFLHKILSFNAIIHVIGHPEIWISDEQQLCKWTTRHGTQSKYNTVT